jgi:glycosyltransferase involved in cell wall biosynthesis
MALRVLLAHNRYIHTGGEEAVFSAELEMLRRRGHDVEVFLDDNHRIAQIPPVPLALSTVWSAEAGRRLGEVLDAFRPDVCHFHNIFPLLSPSVYAACRRRRVAVVQTLHNYRLVCPTATLYRNRRVCEDCVGRFLPWPGVLHGCYRGSRSASSVVAGMLVVHRALKTWRDGVDRYIVPTEFAREKLRGSGIASAKTVVKPHLVTPDPGRGRNRGDFCLYVGRLSYEKGIHTLLEAWRSLEGAVPLRIVGSGPQQGAVETAAARDPSILVEGLLPPAEVLSRMGRAALLLVPSECYEVFPRVLVEAFAVGLPALASDLGGLRELVAEGRTGLRFKPHDPADLAAKVEWMLANPELLDRMSAMARLEYENHYSADANYALLMDIYASAVGEARGS